MDVINQLCELRAGSLHVLPTIVKAMVSATNVMNAQVTGNVRIQSSAISIVFECTCFVPPCLLVAKRDSG